MKGHGHDKNTKSETKLTKISVHELEGEANTSCKEYAYVEDVESPYVSPPSTDKLIRISKQIQNVVVRTGRSESVSRKGSLL